MHLLMAQTSTFFRGGLLSSSYVKSNKMKKLKTMHKKSCIEKKFDSIKVPLKTTELNCFERTQVM